MTSKKDQITKMVNETLAEMGRQKIGGVFVGIDPNTDTVYSTSNMTNAEDLLEVLTEMVYITMEQICKESNIAPAAIGLAIQELVQIAIDDNIVKGQESNSLKLVKNKGFKYEN